MMDFFSAYFLTIGIELMVLFVLMHKRYDIILIIKNGIIASSLTLPFVWFVFPYLGSGYWTWLGLAEIFAFLSESAVYYFLFPKMSPKDAIITSFLCNLASFSIGFALS